MVFRERSEKVAHVRAIAGMIAQVFNVNADRAFSGIIADFAAEVFQEGYDPTLLKQKAERLRDAQAQIRKRKEHDLSMIGRLERMGKYYDQEAKESKQVPDKLK